MHPKQSLLSWFTFGVNAGCVVVTACTHIHILTNKSTYYVMRFFRSCLMSVWGWKEYWIMSPYEISSHVVCYVNVNKIDFNNMEFHTSRLLQAVHMNNFLSLCMLLQCTWTCDPLLFLSLGPLVHQNPSMPLHVCTHHPFFLVCLRRHWVWASANVPLNLVFTLVSPTQ